MEQLVANSAHRITKDITSCYEAYFVNLNCDDVHFDITVKDNATLRLEIVRIKNPKCPCNVDGNINLRRNANLEVVFADFNDEDINVNLHTELRENSVASYHVAATSCKTAKKVFNFGIEHLDPRTVSSVKMRGVLCDNAELHFLGTSDIYKGSVKANTRIEGKIADLSEKGVAEVSPVLNIDENQVVASHGAALGKIPDTSLFYLMSRGLSKKQATSLLTIGYLKPYVMEISDEHTRTRLLSYVEERGFIDD